MFHENYLISFVSIICHLSLNILKSEILNSNIIISIYNNYEFSKKIFKQL